MTSDKIQEKTADPPQSGVAVLTSGGVESCILLAEFQKHHPLVVPVYVKTGLIWEQVELLWLNKFIRAVQTPALKEPAVLDMPVDRIYGEHWSITGNGFPGYHDPDEECYLPGRNIILLSAAAVYSHSIGIDTIVHGTLKNNPFPDATDDFFRYMQKTLAAGLETEFKIITPFRNMSKDEVMEKGRLLPLEYTFSCINPTGNFHCGKCNKCAERIHAFKRAGFEDRTRYAERNRV